MNLLFSEWREFLLANLNFGSFSLQSVVAGCICGMHMRDANAMQLRLNQIDLNVNAEMQLGKSGCWLNYSEGLAV